MAGPKAANLRSIGVTEPQFDEEDEDELEAFLADWEAADRHAAGVLRSALDGWRGAPAPEPALANAAETLRDGLRSDHYPFDWIRRGAGLTSELPADDAELLLLCAAGTISPQDDTGLDPEEEASIAALEHADWLGAIVSAVRAGPGADCSADALVAGVHSCPEIEDKESNEPDEDALTGTAFSLVSLPWICLGLLDDDERLTPVGAWVLPRALARAWGSDFG